MDGHGSEGGGQRDDGDQRDRDRRPGEDAAAHPRATTREGEVPMIVRTAAAGTPLGDRALGPARAGSGEREG